MLCVYRNWEHINSNIYPPCLHTLFAVTNHTCFSSTFVKFYNNVSPRDFFFTDQIDLKTQLWLPFPASLACPARRHPGPCTAGWSWDSSCLSGAPCGTLWEGPHCALGCPLVALWWVAWVVSGFLKGWKINKLTSQFSVDFRWNILSLPRGWREMVHWGQYDSCYECVNW